MRNEPIADDDDRSCDLTAVSVIDDQPVTYPGDGAVFWGAHARSAGNCDGGRALTPEAQATATGDVPDNQVFLAFSNSAARYSLKYPEGWAQQGSGARVTFRDKNNLVRITVSPGQTPSVASVTAAMRRLMRAAPTLRFVDPTRVVLRGATAVKVVYSTLSAPNAVTGKRVELVVDRYYVSHAGNVAVVDLGTPKGVDNVDAYRLMIESFRWR